MTDFLKVGITGFSQEEVDELVDLVSEFIVEHGLFQYIGVGSE